MKTLLFVCVCFVGVTFGRPSQGYRLLPTRAVMFGGYYSNPIFRRSYDIVPRGSMSAVVTRDTVATNSYAGNPPPYPPIDVLPIENETVEQITEKAVELAQPEYLPPSQEPLNPVQVPEAEPEYIKDVQEELFVPSEAPVEAVSLSTEVVTKATKRGPKKKVIRPTPPPAEEEDEEDDGLPAAWPFAGAKGSGPSYNAFFPINISGGAASRSRSQGQGLDDYIPGSATAIANAFSTGKGGVATSHATSFGDPYLASLVRNGLLNFRKKAQDD